MGERIGQVLYLAACIVAAAFAFLSYWSGTHAPDEAARPMFLFGFGAAAVITWLVGRALRYILAGR